MPDLTNYRDFYKALAGDVPKLSEPKAQQLINDALRQIYNSHLWGFLFEQSYILIPDQLKSGTMNVQKGSKQVVPDATAKTAINAFGLTPPITDCQLRVGSGQPYEIDAWDGTNLILSQPYREATNASTAYNIYRAYFSPPLSTDFSGTPVLDFKRFRFIHNRIPGYTPLKMRQQPDLNQADPQRKSFSDPYWYAPFRYRQFRTQADLTLIKDKTPLYEFWPHPTASRNLFCIYERRGLSLSDDSDELPFVLSSDLLMSLARFKAYEWADAHKGEFKELQPVNWSNKRRELIDPSNRGSYLYLLGQAIKLDREVFLTSDLGNYYKELYMSNYPGGNYYQNHSVAGGYVGL